MDDFSAPPPSLWLEATRLAALHSYAILDTPREAEFDDIVQIAADLCQAPMALITLVAEQRQWFKSELGFGMRETGLDVSICARGLLRPELFVVCDLQDDTRFNCNPLVTGKPRLRFYAGAPLLTPEGLPLGMLCVLDHAPRPGGLAPNQATGLRALARQVMTQLELRRLNDTLEQQVEQRTREHDRLWRLSPEMLAVAGRDGRLRGFNPAFGRVLGWSAAALRQQDFLALALAEDRPALAALFAGLAEEAPPGQVEARLRHAAGGHRWVSTAAVLTGGLVYLACRDITAEKNAASLLRQTEEQLRQAQKMEAVGQLTGGIAHDFNNLLTGIIGSLDMLKVRVSSGRMDRTELFLDAALRSANRAAGLVQRLMSFSRRQALSYGAVDVNALLESMGDLLRQSLGETVALQLAPGAALCVARTDANQLENALLNLAINARDAMPQGGGLCIATGAVSLGEDAAGGLAGAELAGRGAEGLAAGAYVVLSVTDTGTGMPPEVLERAFDPFFTTKEVGKGTGLGLSMVYGFAQQTGGKVHIESRPGQGTEVRLYLPCHPGGSD